MRALVEWGNGRWRGRESSGDAPETWAGKPMPRHMGWYAHATSVDHVVAGDADLGLACDGGLLRHSGRLHLLLLGLLIAALVLLLLRLLIALLELLGGTLRRGHLLLGLVLLIWILRVAADTFAGVLQTLLELGDSLAERAANLGQTATEDQEANERDDDPVERTAESFDKSKIHGVPDP